MSAFSSASPKFEAFLADAKDAPALAPGRAGDARNARFIPRNFLLDERIDDGRAASYAAVLPPSGLASFSEWNSSHVHYLEHLVFSKPPAGHDHRSVDTDDPAASPETFRAPLALTPFQGTDLDTYFVRMIAVDDLAWLSGRNDEEIFAFGQRVMANPDPTNPAWDDFGTILEEAFFSPYCDHRPVFSAFYEDFLDELRDPANTDWPNQLRDRLGLYHFNQWSSSFPRRVFLFRYPVSDIPRRQGDADRRPVALPAVLDSRFAEAFCPAPRELRQGQLVNFQPGAPQQPAREVLHLFMPLEPKHLFRVGTVTTSVPDYLGSAPTA
jgi:hypothetical protein